jgi:hypothetical protein
MGLGSGIRDPEKTYSGSRIQSQKGTGSRIRNPEKNITIQIWIFSCSILANQECVGKGGQRTFGKFRVSRRMILL